AHSFLAFPTRRSSDLEIWPWRTLFIIVAPFAALNIFFAFKFMRNVTETTDPPVDYISIILSTLGFGGMLYGFSVAGISGWTSPEVLIPIILGGLIVAIFVRRQLRLEIAILQLRVFKNKYFVICSLNGVMVCTSMVNANNIFPVLMQDMLGYTAFES